MFSLFREEFPKRYFEIDIAEGNMISFASGLSLAGNIVFTDALTVFASGCPFYEFRQGICMGRLNLKIVGSSTGLSDFGGGTTHQFIEDLAIIIKKQGRIDSRCIGQPIWLGPGTFRPVCGHNEVSAPGYIGGDHIELSVMEAYGWGKDTLRMLHCIQIQLGRSVQHMPYLLPVDQIPAVKQRDSWKICKAGCYKIIVLTHSTYGWIRVEPW